MVNKAAYTNFLNQVRKTGNCPIRTFFYTWDEFLEGAEGLFTWMTESSFRKQGFATHARGNK